MQTQTANKLGIEALAVLIASTKRKKRKLSLPEISEWLNIAIKEYGSLSEVAKTIDLSAKMLKQFSHVGKLSNEVKSLFKSRKLDSVDIAYHLSFFPKEDQFAIAQEAVEGRLNSDDIRALKAFRKEVSGLSLTDAIKRIKETKDIKEYVIYLNIADIKDLSQLNKEIEKMIGKENIINFQSTSSHLKIVITAIGRKKLLKISSQEHISMKKLVSRIMNGKFKHDY